jgi:hypothetical protein
LKVQIDLYEVSPEGPKGEKAILTLVCTYSRFPYYRTLQSKEAQEVATSLFDIFLDCGVIPLILQSDLGREFIAAVTKELIVLLGSSQVFSSAFHPQSQGIVERPHRDMTALLSQLISEMVRLRPKTWPNHVRTLEARQRDHFIGDSGFSPRALCNAWFAVTPLQSSLQAVEAIPLDLVYDEWLRSMLTDFKDIARDFDLWESEREDKQAELYNETRVRGPTIEAGSLVLLAKGNSERASGGKLLPRADGPYLVKEKVGDHSVILTELGSGRSIYEGRPQATSRCIHFEFPASLVVPTDAEKLDPRSVDFVSRMPQPEIDALHPGDILAVEVGDVGDESVRMVSLEVMHANQSLCTTRGMVAAGPGPWHHRTWALEMKDGATVQEQHALERLISRVELEGNRLSSASVDLLRSRGVSI